MREVHDHGHGATCLLHDPDGDTVLLTLRFRLPMQVSGQEPDLIETPAGLFDGVEPGARMRAELMEETGYEVEALTHVANPVMSLGSVTTSLACFTGIYRRGAQVCAGGGSAEEGEDIEVLHVPLHEAVTMVRDGRIRDAKTAFAVQDLAMERAGKP